MCSYFLLFVGFETRAWRYSKISMSGKMFSKKNYSMQSVMEGKVEGLNLSF